METTYEYRIIVFKLRNGASWDTCLQGKKLMGYRSVVISEHPVEENETTCEWNYLHYHGIVEHEARYRFDADRIFNQFRSECCEWMKSEKCKFPVRTLAYFNLDPRRIVYRNTRTDESDLPMLEAQVTPEEIEKVKQNKAERVKLGQSKSNDIMILKDMILESNSQSESELMENFCGNSVFEHIFCKRTYKDQFKKALQFAIMSCLDTPYIELVRNYKDRKNQCLSPTSSFRLMQDWMKFQNINPMRFCSDILDIMDKKQRKKNTLVLKGEPNSGKTFIAKAIEKACIFYGEVTQGTAGYAFMWQDCTNKRVIVINEPFFDLTMIESLKAVLEGTGTFVHKKNTSDDYLRPTPIIVTTNNHLWSHCPTAECAIRARCLRIYDNLKAADCLKNVNKDLHPAWILPFLPGICRPATPVSDISDDECPTSQDTATVAPELTSKPKTEPEVPQTPLTSVVDNTTSILHNLQSPKRSSITHLLNAPLRPVRSETYSEALSCSNRGSPQHLTQDLTNLEENKCQTPLKTSTKSKSIRRKLSLEEPETPPTKKQQLSQEEVTPVQLHPWTHCQDPMEDSTLTSLQEGPEEEDKSPQ